MSTLNIVEKWPDYKFPGPRYRTLGQQSGEEFREEYFIPWLDEHIQEKELALDIDGFAAYPPSFFKEFILGTAKKDERYKNVLKRIKIKCESTEFKERIERIVKEIED